MLKEKRYALYSEPPKTPKVPKSPVNQDDSNVLEIPPESPILDDGWPKKETYKSHARLFVSTLLPDFRKCWFSEMVVIRDMYRGSSIRITNRTESTDPIQFKSEVKQGTPIWLTLFSMSGQYHSQEPEGSFGHLCLSSNIELLAFADGNSGKIQRAVAAMSNKPITLKDLAGLPVKGYVLECLIGFGGFGAVYRASNGTQTIAVKCTTRGEESTIEAHALARLLRFDIAPKGLFHHLIDPVYCIGQELLGADLHMVWQKCPGRAMKHPTLLKVAYQAMKCLETLHSVRLIHRDVKTSNFAISRPKTPDNKVIVKILDFGLCHVFKDENGNLLVDQRNLELNKSPYSSFETQMGRDPQPKDDLVQLSYMILQLSGYEWLQKMRSPPDELLEFKRELLRTPSDTLPVPAKFLCPWFEALSELNDIAPIDYGLLTTKLQECLPNHDVMADLILGVEDGIEMLI
ncbi:unnamed protein product [Caenorhabditis nigoni]